MEGDGKRGAMWIPRMWISTHALTWRATGYRQYDCDPLKISTHALTWRATAARGGKRQAVRISTHALTWRATACPTCRLQHRSNFYPRPHMEGDPAVLSVKPFSINFYPRPHMEGDKWDKPFKVVYREFLPTPSHGGRHFSLYNIYSIRLISTHALTWRATLRLPLSRSRFQNFYPRPLTWRATSPFTISIPSGLFLPTPSHGGRLSVVVAADFIGPISTHALTWRATPCPSSRNQQRRNFYPRPHMEGDS